MTYLDELLAGYRQGLASNPTQAIQALRAALAETDEPRQRGTLLGLLAKALAIRAAYQSSTKETPSTPFSVTCPAQETHDKDRIHGERKLTL